MGLPEKLFDGLLNPIFVRRKPAAGYWFRLGDKGQVEGEVGRQNRAPLVRTGQESKLAYAHLAQPGFAASVFCAQPAECDHGAGKDYCEDNKQSNPFGFQQIPPPRPHGARAA